MQNTSTDQLCAKDIMQREIVSVEIRDTLKIALDVMTENHLTGLPVLDTAGRCVGMITATDILNYEQEHSEFTAEANSNMAMHFDMETHRWETVRITSFALEVFADIKVSEIMACNLLSVEADTPVKEIANKMLDGQVHRILVMNEDQRLQGIISATDFVRLFAEG